MRRNAISLLEVLMCIFIISIGLLGIFALLPLSWHLTDGGLQADRAAAVGQYAMRDFKIRGMNTSFDWLNADGSPLAGPSPRSADPGPPQAYVLDPRGVAAGVVSAWPAGGISQTPRITLNSSGGGIMGPLVADEVFCGKDDLHFVYNETTQQLDQTMEPGKRFAAREYSWFYTLVRETSPQYTVSTVVVRGRQLQPAAEFDFAVAAMPGGGTGGGEVLLQSTNPLLKEIRVGNWLALLSGARLRWYRIIATDDVVADQRAVTLTGPDWDTSGTYGSPRAVGVAGVVDVYERTVIIH